MIIIEISFLCLTDRTWSFSLDQKFKDVYGKDINMERLPATSNVA